MPIHTTDTREAALRQLHRINRWLVAGSVVLTGAFVEAAAHAFPGRATKNASTSKVKRTGARVGSPSRTTTRPLQPPAQAPQASDRILAFVAIGAFTGIASGFAGTRA